jgi:hypothetical protein
MCTYFDQLVVPMLVKLIDNFVLGLKTIFELVIFFLYNGIFICMYAHQLFWKKIPYLDLMCLVDVKLINMGSYISSIWIEVIMYPPIYSWISHCWHVWWPISSCSLGLSNRSICAPNLTHCTCMQILDLMICQVYHDHVFKKWCVYG